MKGELSFNTIAFRNVIAHFAMIGDLPSIAIFISRSTGAHQYPDGSIAIRDLEYLLVPVLGNLLYQEILRMSSGPSQMDPGKSHIILLTDAQLPSSEAAAQPKNVLAKTSEYMH